MRTVAILYLSPDSAVDNLLTKLRASTASWTEVAAESFGDDANSFGLAIERLAHRNGDFDTLLLITHGGRDDVPAGKVEFRARTATVGSVVRSHWYLIAEQLNPVVNDSVALISTVCVSSQEEFRDAMARLLPAYAIAGVGTLCVSNAAAGTLAFFRTTKAFNISDLWQIKDAIADIVRTDSDGQLETWMPCEQ